MKSVSAGASEQNSVAHHLHDEEAASVKKIQHEAYGDRWIPLPPLSPSLPLHMDTLPLTLRATTKIHPQSHSILRTSARESFSRFILSGQRFTAERTASPASAGGGLLFRGIIRSHLIFISCWEIRDDKLF